MDCTLTSRYHNCVMCHVGFKSAAHYLVLNNLAPAVVEAAAESSAAETAELPGAPTSDAAAEAESAAPKAAAEAAEKQVATSPNAAGELVSTRTCAPACMLTMMSQAVLCTSPSHLIYVFCRILLGEPLSVSSRSLGEECNSSAFPMVAAAMHSIRCNLSPLAIHYAAHLGLCSQ